MSTRPLRVRTTGRRTAAVGVLAASAFALAACGGGGFEESSSAPEQESGPASLQVMIGSSGDAETTAVEDAVAA